MLKKMVSAALLATPLAFGVMVAGAQDKAADKGAKAAPAADKKGDNVEKDKRGSSPQTDAVARANLADQLARYGDANKDSLALISAARILQSSGAQETKTDKKSEGGSAEGKPKAARDVSVNGMIERAKQHAGGRKDIIAMADEVAKSGSRGAVVGPKRGQTSVNARGADIYNVTFRGGEPAMVAISGDGDTDLDLIVKDENGNVVCASQTTGDDEVCRWNPRWTGAFRIEVRNLGGVYNHYRIGHN